MRLSLPFPPSINHYYGRTRTGQVFIKGKGKAFREEVKALCAFREPLEGSIRMTIDMYPPDRRRRDIDNILKATLDGLEHGGVYENDSQIVKLTVTKVEPVTGGKLLVEIEQV